MDLAMLSSDGLPYLDTLVLRTEYADAEEIKQGKEVEGNARTFTKLLLLVLQAIVFPACRTLRIVLLTVEAYRGSIPFVSNILSPSPKDRFPVLEFFEIHVTKRVKSTAALATELGKLQFNEGMKEDINWIWL